MYKVGLYDEHKDLPREYLDREWLYLEDQLDNDILQSLLDEDPRGLEALVVEHSLKDIKSRLESIECKCL